MKKNQYLEKNLGAYTQLMFKPIVTGFFFFRKVIRFLRYFLWRI